MEYNFIMINSICNFVKKLFAIRSASLKEYIYAIFGTLLIILGPELLFGPDDHSTEVPENLRQIHEVMLGPQDLTFFIVLGFVCLLGPIIEELVFRGALWHFIDKVINKDYAFFFTSILFAAAHGSPEHIVAVFPIGLWVGWLRFRSGSIFPPIIAHVINNSVVSLFLVMQ